MNEKAMKKANAETTAYIQRRGFTDWQLANEPGIQNEVDLFWNESYRDADE
jgi:hypothetical protein